MLTDKDLEGALPDDMIEAIVDQMDLNLGAGDVNDMVNMFLNSEKELKDAIWGEAKPTTVNYEGLITLLTTCSLKDFLLPSNRGECETVV